MFVQRKIIPILIIQTFVVIVATKITNTINNMTATKKSTIENPFGSNFQEATSGEIVKWEKVGQQVKGQVVSIDKQVNMKTGAKELVFTILQEDKSRVRVWERLSYRDNMKQVVVGQHIGFVFTEEKPAKDPGNHPYKVIKLFLGPIEEVSGSEDIDPPLS